jgi:hypothetical protein
VEGRVRPTATDGVATDRGRTGRVAAASRPATGWVAIGGRAGTDSMAAAKRLAGCLVPEQVGAGRPAMAKGQARYRAVIVGRVRSLAAVHGQAPSPIPRY